MAGKKARTPKAAMWPAARARLRGWATRRPHGWRLAVPVICAMAGLLATTSMINARGTDLRGGRYTDLIGLVGGQRAEVQDLRREVRNDQAAVDALLRSVKGVTKSPLHRQLAQLGAPAGLTAVSGRGVMVSLNDAPRGEKVPEGTDPDLLLVHQQDIQAVVNALWAGGAEAVSLQGQRVIATTGIKCVGNTVVLQGVPYAPPYRIGAVGLPDDLQAALDASPEVRAYRDYTAPPYNLRWSLRSPERVDIAAYTGVLTLNFASPTAP
jgi:uncharacterized protein YlxW (UPF0749 family)